MFILYGLVIRTYGLFITLASLFHTKASQLSSGRNTQSTLIKNRLSEWGSCKKIWIHAASYGEYEMAKPIISRLMRDSEMKFIISFHSPSGYEPTHFDDNRFLKIYLPLDLVAKQVEILQLIQPDRVVFIKYEFWFNFLRQLRQRNIPYFFTSLHLNSNSYLFYPLFKPFLNLLKESTGIYCHNENSEQILKEKGFKNTRVLGDTRIAQTTSTKENNIYDFDWPSKDKKLSVAFGSIIPSEFQVVIQFINQHPEMNFLIAPHDIDNITITKLKQLIKAEVSLYSREKNPQSNIIIVDTLGDLKYLYKFCDLAYVGAGFEKGPHNVLEPLVYGLPTLCGPNIQKFPMAELLAAKQLVTIVPKMNDLGHHILKLSDINQLKFNDTVNDFFASYPDNMDKLIKELNT